MKRPFTCRVENLMINFTSAYMPREKDWRNERNRKELVKKAIKSGALFPGSRLIRGYGWEAHRAFCAWCNLPVPLKRYPTSMNYTAARQWREQLDKP